MSESWLQIITVVFANLTAIWWFRKECREDWKMSNDLIRAIQEEMKDFHERLLKIEMNRKN